MNSLSLESNLVAAVGNVILGLAVFLRKPGSPAHRAFGALSLAIAVWNAGDFGFHVVQASGGATAPWHRLAFIGSMAIPLAAFFLMRALTGRGRDWTRLYGLALVVQFAVVVALLWTDLFPHPYNVVAAAYQFSNLALCLLLLFLRFPQAGSVERLQIKYLIAGGLAATCLGATDYLAAHFPSVPRLGAPAILLYLCLVSAAIGRHGLFSAGRTFGRWVAILVAAFGFAALYEGVVRFKPPGLLGEVLTPLLVAVLAVALYDPLRESLRVYRDRARSGFEDLAERIAGVGRRLVFASEPERWQEIVLHGLREIPVVESAAYLPLEESPPAAGNASHGASHGAIAARAAVLLADGEPEPFLRREPVKGLMERAVAAGLRYNLVVPVQDRERLYGLLALELKKPRLNLEPEHLDILSLLGTQAGLICQGIERLRWLKRQEELGVLAEMAAGAAHEIRNPLGAIRGAVDLLLEDPGDRSERFLELIREEVARLERFLGDFLAYGKPGRLDVTPIDLAALAREGAESLALRPEAPPVAVSGDPEVWVKGDRTRLKQVLENLLLNAAQAAGRGGRIEVRVGREPGGASMRVRDNGPGIPSEMVPRLFRPFFTTRSDGTGLGLAICARIADLHGGRISASNWKEPGGRNGAVGGAEFLLRLPGEPPGQSGGEPPERPASLVSAGLN